MSTSKIEHYYFDSTPPKDWKLADALLYYINQNVSTGAAYDLAEISLKRCIETRKAFRKRGQALLKELTVMKTINQSLPTTTPSSSTPLTPVPTDAATSSSTKVADLLNNYGSINQINNINQLGKRKGSKKAGDEDGRVEIKKNKKLFQFSRPISHQFLVINKPRITDKDASLIKSTFEIFIASSPSTPTSIIITEEYNSNMKDQDANECLKKLPKVQEFLMQAIDGNYANFLDRVMCYKADNYHSKNEVQAINLLKYILIDYHANCEKPAYYTGTNERTPYCEHIIPVFKYFSAVYKNLSFMWCEKGLEANKQLAVCLDDEQKKLMDGIGYSVKDKAERLVMECSGEVDGEHTEEDTLKLMEATSRCLKNEMGRYQSASWLTFGGRKVFAIQVINNTITLLSTKRVEGNKWAFIEQRSALIPRDWDDSVYWVKAAELLMKLNELLAEQEEVTRRLKNEHVGLITVNPEDSIKNALSKMNTN